MRKIVLCSMLAVCVTALAGCDQTTNGTLESRGILEGPVGYDRAVVENNGYERADVYGDNRPVYRGDRRYYRPDDRRDPDYARAQYGNADYGRPGY